MAEAFVAPRAEKLLFIRLGTLRGGAPGSPAQYIIQVQSAPVDHPVLTRTYPFHLSPSLQTACAAAHTLLEAAIDSDFPDQLNDASPAFKALISAGEELLHALGHHREIADVLKVVLNSVDSDGHGLFCQIQCDADELATLFWGALAYTANDQRSLFFSTDKAVALHVPSGRYWTGPTDVPERPLRILMVSSSFDSNGTSNAHLLEHIGKERESIEKVWKRFTDSGLVTFRHRNNPQPNDLKVELDRFRPHVLHYYGQGFLHDGDECVVLADDEGRGQVIGWSKLSEILTPTRTRHLRLIVLNACKLAQRASLGRRLVGLGVPAVVAMRATIHADAVTEFTPRFYQSLAEGKYIHEAFREAQDNIRWRPFRAVEAFVPMLVHGSLTGIALLDRSRPEFNEVWESAEKRRRQAEALAEQLRKAFESVLGNWQDPVLQNVLRAAVEVRSEPRVAEALQEIGAEMLGRLEEKARAGDWLGALPMCSASKPVAPFLTAEGAARLGDVCGRIEGQARSVLARRKTELQRLHREKKWVRLEEEARSYLDVDPQDPDVPRLLAEAHRFAQVAIDVLDDGRNALGPQFRRILDLVVAGDLDQANSRYASIEKSLSKGQRDEYQQLFQAAIVRRHRERLDLAREKVSALMRAGHWDDAEKTCAALRQGLKSASPEWDQLMELHTGVREGRARQAERRHDWEALRLVALQIREDREMTPLHQRARDWLARSQKLLELRNQIQVF